MNPPTSLRSQIQAAKKIGIILDRLFPNPQVPLIHKDPYTLLIAVLLSARCTDERVNQITPLLFALADTPEKMVQFEPEEIQAIIRPCGLSPTKSRAIWQLSHDLLSRHKSVVPRSFAALEALPGIGHKSASVVMAQAFDIPAFPVDTHIFRCARKWGLSKGKTASQVENDVKRLIPKKYWIRRHLQIIYFARKYCPARGHCPQHCPICQWLEKLY